MDSGAHFHRCDFQVHTPRDRQWGGASAVTETERQQYAREFIAACRARNLDAVAITDHHDMAFVPYLRAAAAAEAGSNTAEQAVLAPIIVFPGMELTLGVPCQALVIFDADFPDDMFVLAMTALAIAPAQSSDQHAADVVRLNHLASFAKVHEELDKHAYLRGKYIILPNVSEGGSTTLLRSGHSGHYHDMPCVGGYLDGDAAGMGDGNTRILNGLDPQYGEKALGLFQTSDNRARDFAVLGRSSTWVKWAEPTAEALRQACLARHTRLSQTLPVLPTVWITSVEVSNCSFLGPVVLELNQQYNALIGGRGTGKSTILEYLRWGLCDEARADGAGDEGGSDGSRTRRLVEQTLVPHAGVLQVQFIRNGVLHSVRRNSATGEIVLKIGSGNYEACKDGDVRDLLPIQAYSQKQLSSVAVRLDELRRFVRTPIRRLLGDIQAQLLTSAQTVRESYGRVRAKRALVRDVENDERELQSLQQQTSQIRSEITGLSDEDRGILERRPQYEKELDLTVVWENELARVRQAVVGAQEALATAVAVFQQPVEPALPNAELLEAMRVAAFETLTRSNAALTSEGVTLAAPSSGAARYMDSLDQWNVANGSFVAAYDQAKGRSTTQQGKLDQLSELEEREKAVRTRLASRRNDPTITGDPESGLAAARDEWCRLHETRSTALKQQCATLTQLSDGAIRATLVVGGATDVLTERLKTALTGSNIRKERFADLADHLIQAEVPIRYAQGIFDELEALSVLDADSPEAATLPAPLPLLRDVGFSDAELGKMVRKLTPDTWTELVTIPLDDQPRFEYRLRENEYIPFENASAGQQATALLGALLNQDGPPLIIDQPEDDLDNQVLLKIVERIWGAKQRRQLIFASHNANMVVNGDADLVVAWDYRVTGEQAGGLVKCQGAIDIKSVRDEIAAVMEGGKAAFRLRRDKYGF